MTFDAIECLFAVLVHVMVVASLLSVVLYMPFFDDARNHLRRLCGEDDEE